jgi:hypothetical protein
MTERRLKVCRYANKKAWRNRAAINGAHADEVIDVRYWHKADIATPSPYVCFRG